MSFFSSDGTTKKQPLSLIATVLLLMGTVIVPLFVLPFTRDPFQLPKQFALYVVVLGVLLLWLLKGIVRKELVVRHSLLDWPVLVLGLLACVSGWLSVLPLLSFLGDPVNAVMHVSFLLACLLWFWLMVQQVRSPGTVELFLQVGLGTSAFAALVFLLRSEVFLSYLIRVVHFNTVTSSNSLFGMYIGIMGTLAFGLLMIKRRSLSLQIVPAIAGILAVATMARLGFTLCWLLFAVGLGLLLVLGVTMLAESRIPTLSFIFFLFLMSIVFIVSGTPDFVKSNVPVEVALGASTSWHISVSAFIHSAKAFLIGNGPGTFIYSFSQYRPDAFNTSDIAASVRFYQPFNTFLAFLSEFGLVGALLFIAIVLLAVGAMFSAWLKTRPTVWQRAVETVYQMKGQMPTDTTSTRRLEAYVLVAAWLTATVGLSLAFYETVLFWFWWWLLALSVIALAGLVPGIIKEKVFALQVSPQYSLLLSFGMVFLCTAVVIFATLGGRLFLAEVAYTKAANTTDLNMAQTDIERALNYRSSFIPYRVAHARVLLQQAITESGKSAPDANRLSQLLSQAVNEAREAAEAEPNNIETWDTLATMYVNGRALAPDANQWAEDALKHAIAIEPSNAALYVRLANVYEFANKKKEAEDAYKQAIMKKPDFLQAYNSLSALYESENNLDAAIALYQPIVPLIEKDPASLFALGRLFFNRKGGGDDAKAETLFLTAVQLQPNYSDALYSLGLLYERRGDRTKALQYYQKVLELNPNNGDVRRKVNSFHS